MTTSRLVSLTKKRLRRLLPLVIYSFYYRLLEKIAFKCQSLKKAIKVFNSKKPVFIVKYSPTYDEDGLFTNHNCDFINDPPFKAAYDAGFATGASRHWHWRWRLHVLCWLAERASQTEGDFVGCGTCQRMCARTVAQYINFEKLNKTFYLIDTVSGLVWAWGLRAVEAAIAIEGRVVSLYCDQSLRNGRRQALCDLAAANGSEVHYVEEGPLDDMTNGAKHDGIAALCRDVGSVAPGLSELPMREDLRTQTERTRTDQSLSYEERYDAVVQTFADFSNIVIYPGVVPDVLPDITTDKICFLHIELESAASAIAVGECFWDRLMPSSPILVDIYGYPAFYEQKLAWDVFAEARGLKVLSLPTGQGLILKP